MTTVMYTAITTRTLGSIANEVGGIIRTGPFGSQLHESDYTSEGIPVIMPKNIVEGKVSTINIARIPIQYVERLAQHKLHVGDIIYGRRGDIGRCALITLREAGWLCGTGCLRISLGDKVIDPEFLYYYLSQTPVVKLITNQAVGATFSNLNTEILRNVDISYPNLPTQRKIANILSTWDRAINLTTQLIAAKQQQKRGLMQQLLTGKKRFPAFQQKQWSGTSFGQIFHTKSIKNTGSQVKNSITVGKYAIRPQNEHFNRIIASDNLENYNIIEQGDFVYDPMSAYYGAFGRYELDKQGIVSPVYRVLNINPDYDSDFMKHFIKSHYIAYQLSANSSQGNREGKRRTIQAEAFDSISFKIPDIDEQCTIAKVLNACDDELALLNRKLELLKKQKQGLMQQLLTGKVRVKT